MTHMNEPTPTWSETIARATIAAIPYAGGALEIIYSDVRTRRAAKASESTEQIVEAVTESTLLHWLESKAIHEALFVNAIDAAIRSGLEAKRRLLSQTVIAAVQDESNFDESYMLSEVLAQLDVPHVNTLRRLSDEWDECQPPNEGEASWGLSQVWNTTPMPIKAALVRTGTCLPESRTLVAKAGKNRQVGISDYGLELVSRLRSEGLENDD